jgi:predicted DNA-binding transcriptional regulator AlpA
MDELLTVEEVAAITKLPKSRLNKARIGLIDGPAFIKIGHLVRYRKQDLIDWINSHQAVFVSGD